MGVIEMMDPETLARLVDAHTAALVLYARQWCDAAEDVVQEAFVKLAGQSRLPERPVPWLYRVVRNNAISAARSQHRRRRHERAAASQTPGWFVQAEEGGLESGMVAEAMQRLPMEQREIIVAHLWGGLTFEQIGEVVRTPTSTVHRRYVQGLSALRERLGVTCPQKK